MRTKKPTTKNDKRTTNDSDKRHEAPNNAATKTILPNSIKGTDDTGVFYANHAALHSMQQMHKSSFYVANAAFWSEGGYGGLTDEEAMVGDDGCEDDGIEGLAFLDRYLAGGGERTLTKPMKMDHAMDAGAGVGRLTKSILLKRYNAVRLVEADGALSRRSRTYLGHKRADRCTFTVARLESLDTALGWGKGRNAAGTDLVWIQWTLQYLTDADAVVALKSLSRILTKDTGVMIVKENRPYGVARADRFQMDTPGISGRYDITRTDDHHRLLFDMAGLVVDLREEGVETNTYALVVKPSDVNVFGH